VRYSSERYFDTATGRLVVVGRHDNTLVMIPYEADKGSITLITIPCNNASADQVPAQDWEAQMNKTCMVYFEKDDVLHLAISDKPEKGSVELGPDITVELRARFKSYVNMHFHK
jgi:hypothetical protein